MRIKSAILSLAAMLLTLTAMAETGTMSPYSRYGYGLLNDHSTSMQRSMGGIGHAMAGNRQINVKNPASYAQIDSLTFLFDLGLSLTNLWSEEPGGKARSTGGGLDYITLQFPIGKYMGGSIGVLPYSSTGYSFGSDIAHGTQSHSGAGGINELYAGVSGRPFKGFSIGANFYYLWGQSVNDIYATSSGATGTSTLFERVIDVKDWNFTVGAQYAIDVTRRDNIRLGLTFTPGRKLHGHAWGVYYDTNNDTKPDTVGYQSLKGNYSIPATWGAGISYTRDNRIFAEVDFTFQKWSKAMYNPIETFEQTTFADRKKISAGVQYSRNPRGNYLQRMQWRLGASYTNDYITVAGNKVKDATVSFGIGFPVPGGKSVLNLGFEYRHRNTTPTRLVTENYFNITLGINFNEMWFWTRKIN